MVGHGERTWTFLTRHAQILVVIASNPGLRLRDIGDRVGITERAAHRIVSELAQAGYITRTRTGRRNSYTVNTAASLADPVARQQNVGELLALLSHQPPQQPRDIDEQAALGPTPAMTEETRAALGPAGVSA